MRGGDHYSGSLYKFAAGDRSGVLLGLNLTQAAAVVGGAMVGLLSRAAGGSFLVAFGWWALFGPLAFVRYRGRFWAEWLITVFRWVWVRRWPLWWTDEPWDGQTGEPPRALTGYRIEDAEVEQETVGVIWDDQGFTAAAIVKLRGRDFDVLSPGEQDQRLYDFARGLAFSAGEGSPVVRFCWTHRAFRQNLAEHRRFLDGTGHKINRNLRRQYVELVEAVGSDTVRHEVFLTVVVSQQRAGAKRTDLYGRSDSDERAERIVSALNKQLRQVESFMREGGIEVDGRLRRAEIAEMMQEALDPTQALGLATRTGRLEDKLLKDQRCGPIQTELKWAALRIDGGWHRSYRVTEWPRVPVRANWMPRLLSRSHAARTFSVVFETTSGAKSQAAVDRQLTKLETDARLAGELKRRVKESSHRARAEILQRDEELAAGFPEVRLFGVVTISAPDEPTLLKACEEFESAASTAMLVVAPCDGEHDLGWAASLPLCVGGVRALGA